ncbi:MAG: tyrosine-type recombinase/integrase [Thermoguttaceae bacterium]|nr:tyrosine-type recombinase/integrase [Thermoguttaceae bacterium]
MTKKIFSGKKSGNSKKISKISKNSSGLGLPSIYQTKRGDFYCTYRTRKIYLGRDPETARSRLIQMLTEEDRQLQKPAAECTLKPFRKPIVKKKPLPEQSSHDSQTEPEVLEVSPPPVECKAPEPPVPTIGKVTFTVTELVVKFLDSIRNHSHFYSIRTAMKTLSDRYGFTDVEDFGPIALKDCREQFLAADYDRNYINALTRYIVDTFKFGVANELVSEGVAVRLTFVKPLKQGEARENAPREEVPDSEIIKTLPHLLPTIRDMVILQRISGMRPSELFRMTLEQFVKRDPDGWVYMPFKHKTQIHNKSRVIGFGKYEISILERHARGKKPDEPLFSPRDAWLERAERLGRKTPQPQPNYNNYYTKDSYSTNIARTIKRANERMRKEGRPESDLIQHWSPYQLRHATATFLSLLMSRDDAATALGHASTNTTQIYDHSEVEKALRFVRERDKTCGGAIAGLIHQFE